MVAHYRQFANSAWASAQVRAKDFEAFGKLTMEDSNQVCCTRLRRVGFVHASGGRPPSNLLVLPAAFPPFIHRPRAASRQFHATCLDTWPPIFYLNDTSKAVIQEVHAFNEEQGRIAAAYTFDAGPNAVVFCEEKDLVAGGPPPPALESPTIDPRPWARNRKQLRAWTNG